MIQCGHDCSGYDADIILIFFSKSLIAVDLILGHRFIAVSDPDERAAQSAVSAIKAGSLGQIHTGNLRSCKAAPVFFDCGQQGAYDRLHLQGLLVDLFLQILHIINADFLKIIFLFHPEQQNAAFVLI